MEIVNIKKINVTSTQISRGYVIQMKESCFQKYLIYKQENNKNQRNEDTKKTENNREEICFFRKNQIKTKGNMLKM